MLVILNKDEYDNLNKKGNGGCCGIIILLIIKFLYGYFVIC